MKDGYKTIAHYGEAEIIINKSRFIGYAMPIQDENEALEFIKKIQDKHKDATHNVYAYVIGEESNIQRFNDDGEPSGTAGIPALEVLKKEDLRNSVVVVTRYFGGIKLGGGGLIRAYTKASKIGIEQATIIRMNIFQALELVLKYTSLGKIENYLKENNHIIENIDYLQDVIVRLYVYKDEMNDFINDLNNLTNGEIQIKLMDEKFLPTKDGVRYIDK